MKPKFEPGQPVRARAGGRWHPFTVVSAAPGPRGGVRVTLRSPDGRWVTVVGSKWVRAV